MLVARPILEFGLARDCTCAGLTVRLIGENSLWDHDGQPYWEGEVEECINGRTVASPTWEGDGAATTGQANVWGSITFDPARDLVLLPTSSPSPDFYGGLRRGDNLYANSRVSGVILPPCPRTTAHFLLYGCDMPTDLPKN